MSGIVRTFHTPLRVAQKQLKLIGPVEGLSLLEPSAGLGVVALLAHLQGANVTVIELDSHRHEFLDGLGCFDVCLRADFLALNPRMRWDCIAMSPPAIWGQEILHLAHAMSVMKEKGRLTAILPATTIEGPILSPVVRFADSRVPIHKSEYKHDLGREYEHVTWNSRPPLIIDTSIVRGTDPLSIREHEDRIG